MRKVNLHLSDEELLLMTDGELSARRAAQVRAHLAACWSCRSRMAEIEGTILDFAQAYRGTPGAELPPAVGPRALLSARLAQIATKSGAGFRPFMSTWTWLRAFSVIAGFAAVSVALFNVASPGTIASYRAHFRGAVPESPSPERGVVPNSRLTPGATRTATILDLCSAAHEEVVGQITAPLRSEVLQEYGIAPTRAGEYEIDYLIAPGLGGTEEIHNLWPQSYATQNWNAAAKDALEERLHQLVCGGKLDLSMAQHDIASDWIAAYKKYFQTDRPLPSEVILAPSNSRGTPMAALEEP